MSNMPPRHGQDWSRVQPTPITPREARGVAIRAPELGPQPAPGGFPAGGVLPVRVLDAFYQALPAPSLQPVVKTVEGKWSAGTVAGDEIALVEFSVPGQFTYIFTDIYYYAVCPSAALEGPNVALGPYQLAGLLRYNLTFGDRTPMRIDASLYSPYSAAGGVEKTGWPLLDTVFGTRRGGAFALYAKSRQVVRVIVTVDVLPRFTIDKFGAHLHGFAVPESQFDSIFSRMR